MLTRQEILNFYEVDSSGMIQSRGKFEGEQLYAPYFYGALMEGSADEDNGGIAYFVIQPQERLEFPELGEARKVGLLETEQGFVYVKVW